MGSPSLSSLQSSKARRVALQRRLIVYRCCAAPRRRARRAPLRGTCRCFATKKKKSSDRESNRGPPELKHGTMVLIRWIRRTLGRGRNRTEGRTPKRLSYRAPSKYALRRVRPSTSLKWLGFDFFGGYGIIGTDKRWVGRYHFLGKFSRPWYMY